MNNEPFLNEQSRKEKKEKLLDEPEIIINKPKGYGNYDVFNSANIFSKLFFCWVNKVLSVYKKLIN